MINKLLKFSYVIVAVGLLFAQYASAIPTDDDLSVLSRLGYFSPAPLEPQLSSDGKTLYNAVLPVVYVDDPNPSHEPVHIPAPIDLLNALESATATFSITYVPNGGTDPWDEPCYTFPDEAKAAFDAAANIWANILQSSVPITISACWANLGSSSTLGYSGGGNSKRDFTGAPLTHTWYRESLANALAGSDLVPGSFDMYITYNNNFSWYYGTDGNTPSDQHDLMSVVLHEIAHGLNFSGSMDYSGGQGSWGGGTGYPDIYDTFMRDGSGNQLINTSVYGNPSTALGTALTSDDIWFHGSNAMAANGDQRVKMYAPSTWDPGSSYSHLDYSTFHGTANRLMVYAISAGDSIHDPGPVTKGLLKDLGWPTSGNGDVFDSCSLINKYQPSFEWTANETFSKSTILFSTSSTDFSNPIAKATLQAPKLSWTPPSGTWKKILGSSYNNGIIQDIYWKVVLARPDKSTEETEVRSFRIEISQKVTIQSPANGASLPSGTPPTIVFDTNCNTKFKLEISSLNDFSNPSKTAGFSYTVNDPNVQTTLQKTLTPGQWTAVKKLVGTGTGYFRIKGWDGLNREIVSEVRTFTINGGGADLVVQSLTFSVNPVAAGGTTRISFYVKNQGAAAAGAHREGLYIDGNYVAYADCSGLAAGASQGWYYDYTNVAASPNPHMIKARADKDGQVSETDEGNNEMTQNLSVI